MVGRVQTSFIRTLGTLVRMAGRQGLAGFLSVSKESLYVISPAGPLDFLLDTPGLPETNLSQRLGLETTKCLFGHRLKIKAVIGQP